MARHAVGLALTIGLLLVWPNANQGQILQGDWVDQSQAEIEKYRKTDVTVIVLDQEDRAVQGARVRLVQKRHDFVIGLTLPSNRMPPSKCRIRPVYRCFNAIALDRYTDWSPSSGDSLQVRTKRLAAWQLALEPMRTHFGRVISADPARNHDRLSLLNAADLRDAVLARIDLAAVFDPVPDDYDLYADMFQQDMIERKLGQGMINRMFDRAEAARPRAGYGIRVHDAISLNRGRDVVVNTQRLEVRQVPFDHITIDQTFPGPIQPKAFRRMLDEYVVPLPKPVTLAGFEVGGRSPVAAAINLETLLRLVFAQPRIDGIYLRGLLGDELLEKQAALLDDEGQPTASGEVMDQLFNKIWHSDEQGVSDERGNVSARVFTGMYAITASLPNGRKLKSQVHIPKNDRPKLIVLQVTRAEEE
ncbi:MAG: hypothetical protein AAGC72_01570 [Planctomycetota bacterium]